MATSILLVIIFIGVLITFHEFGHLIVAKLAHIPVESFSVGFGPVILKKKIGETEYRLSIIPLGGYIKMTGEENPEEGGFSQKPLGIRIAVIAAGPFFNLVLGFVLMVTMYLIFGIKYLPPVIDPVPNSRAESIGLLTADTIVNVAGETIPSFEALEQTLQAHTGKEVSLTVRRQNERLIFTYLVPESLDIEPFMAPVIDRVRSGSPAAKIGLKPGDRIISVAGINVRRWNDFVEIVRENGGKSIPITYQRQDKIISDSITPAVEKDQMSEEKFGQIGVWVMLPRISLSLPRALWEALRRTGYITVQTFVIIYKVVTRKISTRAIGGPIMVAKIAYEGASWGAEYFLALWALLSINLFVVNMLPIPVLDGGRIVLDLIGGIRRRRLTDKELTWASNIGWMLIGLLIAFTIFNDLLRLIKK
ncbi:MAG: RIP metalloprotease RseP [candidate division WOR-3 bacterium]|jgi:regulator of sigma E protease|nr:RIP metalloprotease RseP [candidate division WOR-3 bacterium]MDH7518446.1 RIP metalloprotease RseP [bacterium]